MGQGGADSGAGGHCAGNNARRAPLCELRARVHAARPGLPARYVQLLDVVVLDQQGLECTDKEGGTRPNMHREGCAGF